MCVSAESLFNPLFKFLACVDLHERTCTISYSGDSYFSAQLSVNLRRTARYSFGCVCSFLVQRAEEVVREVEQLSVKLK